MSEHLTTAQVARRLGVKPETVYAYVSRGLLTSTRLPNVRGSVFDVEEVERLADREGARRVAGSVERIRTQLTLIEDDELYYRGIRAVDLADRPFECVAEFLWSGALPDDAEFRGDPVALDVLPAAARSVDRLRLVVDVAAARDPLRSDIASRSVIRCARALLGTVFASLELPPSRPDVLNAALVLLADHDLAASTLAARVAASTRANPYAVVAAGLGAMDGPLHGSVGEQAYRLLDDPITALGNAFRLGQRVPGFGHMVYDHRDPRAEHLLAMIDSPAAQVIVTEMRERTGLFPNSDFALAVVSHELGLGPQAPELVFALARIAGWIAHALEEYNERPLRFRVPGVYTGARPQP